MDRSSKEPAPLLLPGWAKEGTRQKEFGGGDHIRTPVSSATVSSVTISSSGASVCCWKRKKGFRKLVKVEASFLSGVSLAGNTSLGALRSLAGAHIATPFFFLPSFKMFVIAFLFNLYA